MGTRQPRCAQFGDDVLQVGRVLHRRRGDAHDLAADGDQVERLLHAGGGVHRVAGDHGLHDDGMIAADDDAAARGIADDDFAGLAAAQEVRAIRSSVTHVQRPVGGRSFLLLDRDLLL